MIKSYDFTFPNRYEFDSSKLEFRDEGVNGAVNQFKTARGRNVLKTKLPSTDNPSVPSSKLQRLTDGNLSYPFRQKDITEFVYTLPAGTNVNRIRVLHEPGTQPNDVLIAISNDNVNLDILFNNDQDNSLGFGAGSDPLFTASWEDDAVSDPEGWDPVRQLRPLASNGSLVFDLNCPSAQYLHVYTAGFTSSDAADPSSNETRISEIELYDCVYGFDRPEMRTKESIRLTSFTSLDIDALETSTAYLLWNPVVGGKDMFYDGVDWIVREEAHQSNTTAEILANIDSLFTLPTVYEVGFAIQFVSEDGEESAQLLGLTVEFENDAAVKAITTTVFGRIAEGVGGTPDDDLYLTIDLELGGKDNVTTASIGSDTRIVFASDQAALPDARGVDPETLKVDANGLFRRELIPNSIMTNDKSQYVFTFWRKNKRNGKSFIPVHAVTAEIPKTTKYDLGNLI